MADPVEKILVKIKIAKEARTNKSFYKNIWEHPGCCMINTKMEVRQLAFHHVEQVWTCSGEQLIKETKMRRFEGLIESKGKSPKKHSNTSEYNSEQKEYIFFCVAYSTVKYNVREFQVQRRDTTQISKENLHFTW